jgi:hypothetical protein
MIQIVYWQSGAHFWDPPVNEVVDDVIFIRRASVEPRIADCSKIKLVYSRATISASSVPR